MNAEPRLFERHRECDPHAMTYDESGARCSSCGQRWVLTEHGYVLAGNTAHLAAWAE